jgi:hypothetical protein
LVGLSTTFLGLPAGQADSSAQGVPFWLGLKHNLGLPAGEADSSAKDVPFRLEDIDIKQYINMHTNLDV